MIKLEHEYTIPCYLGPGGDLCKTVVKIFGWTVFELEREQCCRGAHVNLCCFHTRTLFFRCGRKDGCPYFVVLDRTIWLEFLVKWFSWKKLKESEKVKWFVVESKWHKHLEGTPFEKKFECGWGNGYAALPPCHPCYGLHFNDIEDMYPELEVHGGLTYSAKSASQVGPYKGHWIVGFDTAHYADTLTSWPESRVQDEAQRLAHQLQRIYAEHRSISGRINRELAKIFKKN